jgi:hypothetical protein
MDKLFNQDPNGIMDLEDHQCRMTNDFVDWDSLHGPVKTYKLKECMDNEK